MKVKVTKPELAILGRMKWRETERLILQINTSTVRWRTNNDQVSYTTFESLKKKGLIEYESIASYTAPGHYYRLTDLAWEIPVR